MKKLILLLVTLNTINLRYKMIKIDLKPLGISDYPWSCDTEYDDPIIIDLQENEIACNYIYSNTLDSQDYRVITVAPEMLEALIKIYYPIAKMIDKRDKSFEYIRELIEKATCRDWQWVKDNCVKEVES
jgi:hypothetical protein